MKLIVAGLLGAAAGAMLSSVRTAPASAQRADALQLCQVGGVELIDERCDPTGACAKQSVRLRWDHGEGVLFEGDSTGEKERRRIHAPLVGPLLSDLSSLEPGETDLQCGSGNSTATERALTITTDCGALGTQTFTFIRAQPAWDRVASNCIGECIARRAWHAAFATHLAARFGTVFHQLREVARGG